MGPSGTSTTYRAGSCSIADGSTSVTCSFSSSIGTALYSVAVTVTSDTDSGAANQAVDHWYLRVSNKTDAGFVLATQDFNGDLTDADGVTVDYIAIANN
jgi:hypothetical protein